jgi:hypothetical protein
VNLAAAFLPPKQAQASHTRPGDLVAVTQAKEILGRETRKFPANPKFKKHDHSIIDSNRRNIEGVQGTHHKNSSNTRVSLGRIPTADEDDAAEEARKHAGK